MKFNQEHANMFKHLLTLFMSMEAKMRRITHLLLVFAFFISAAPSLFIGMPASGAVEAFATVEPPPPNQLFLPMVNRSEPTYKVSGRVVDSKNQPMAAVTITDNQGRSTLTDSQGNYTLNGLKSGDYAVAPSRSGFVFSPSMLSGDLPDQAADRNFTAILVNQPNRVTSVEFPGHFGYS